MHSAEPGFLLTHPCGLRIESDLREVSASGLTGVEARDMGNGYVWYVLPHAQIAARTVAMSLCFFEGALEGLSVAVVEPELYGASWSDWSAEREAARARATARWLADVGYEVGRYAWGTVFAGIDPKTGDGSGGIRFERLPSM
jgi:hypothetical protein